MKLKKVKTVDDLQQLIINNNDKEGFYGDGKDIPDIPDIPIIHKFADQVYIRQMNDGGEIVDYIAPCYNVSKPGARRVIYAHEDSIFVNVHKNPTNEKDIKKLEEEIVSITKKDYEKHIKQLKQ